MINAAAAVSAPIIYVMAAAMSAVNVHLKRSVRIAVNTVQTALETKAFVSTAVWDIAVP